MDERVAIRIETPVQVDSGLCSRYRSTKSACAACAMVCPVAGAVRLSDAGAAITDACVGCGACVAACPNGALRPLEDDARLSQRIRERIRPGEGFRIACSRAQGRAHLVVPCLSRLTEAVVLEPLRGGASGVELASPECAACGLRKTAPQAASVLRFAAALCEAAGLEAGRVARLTVAAGQAQEARPAGPHPRRALFRAAAERWQATVDEAARAAQATPAADEAPVFRDIVRQHAANHKRAHLLQVLAALPGARPASRTVPAADVPLARLEADRRCVGCNVCETLCPVGALRHREEGGRYALELDAALCTGCGVCAAVCYHQALRVAETVDLAVLFERPRLTLVSATRRTCNACRESFFDESSELCPSCRLSGDRRNAIARRFFMGGIQSDQT